MLLHCFCGQLIIEFVEKENIPLEGARPAQILLGRDTRPSGESLLEAAKQGINSILGAVAIDMGIVTTPQLHWMVRAQKGVKASELDYFEQLSSSFRCLMDLIPSGSTFNEVDYKLVVDGANSVGGEKLEVLKKRLDGLAIEVRNSGKDGGVLNEGVGADYLTGRVEEKRRWSEGIHQAIEAKEGLKIQADSVIVAQITYQSLFKLYPKLSGMTGTAKTEEKEFLKMFQIPVIEVPTNLPNIRKDLPIQAFATARGKWDHVRQEVAYIVENSEHLSNLLREWNIPHNVLHARPKYAGKEAEIVAQAGQKNAITISTNMAGRGTDIILGGNPKMLAKEIIEDQLLSGLTREAPNVEVDGGEISQKVLSKTKVKSSSLALLAKAALMAKYVCKSEGKSWTYQKAKTLILEAVEMSQSINLKDIEKLVDEESEMYPLGPTIALAYLSVVKDCEVHCSREGYEVKRIGGLHVIGTSLHGSRRIDNQTWF
ncbi:hypothetical protein CMV_019893 [Castanea mollissima]|uniref:chloroplast protein-transporting ATPase n=1 Tax=Castanea mollissima TaxID=60419 RepID=A0A8J4QRJ2_9ROSI|nr:hypothetical protein CMV_019893 [Castanea mollissima]